MAGIFRIACRSRYVGVDFVNVLYAKCGLADFESSGTPTAEAVATAVGTGLMPTYRAVLSPDYSVADVTVERIVDRLVTEAAVAAVGANGTLDSGPGGPLPREVCMLLRLTSTRAGRSGKGRLFLPGPLKSNTLDGPDAWLTSNAYWTNAGTLGALLVTGFVDADDTAVNFGVYSRVHDEWNALVGQARDARPHWLRSRMTAP